MLERRKGKREKSRGQVSTRSPDFYIGFDLSGKRPGGVQKRVVGSKTAGLSGEAVESQSSVL